MPVANVRIFGAFGAEKESVRGATLTRRSEAGEFKGVGYLDTCYANKKDCMSSLPEDAESPLAPCTHKATRASCPCRWHPELFGTKSPA